jgi:iron complex outermembrane recepter protein
MLSSRLRAGASLFAIVVGSGATWAQDAAPKSVGLEDIVVTARKREENLQEVPLAVKAFTAEAIESAGLRSVADLATQTPGFSFRSAFGRTADRPVIRGMSNIQGRANAAFFLDGIFISGSTAGLPLDNLERVEIIRGPQSALYGRNTFSGAVNFIPRKTGNEFEAKITGTVAQADTIDVSGYLGGAIVQDKLFVEINARNYTFGGQYTNLVDSKTKLGAEKSSSVGVTLRFKPTDNFEITSRVFYSEDRDAAPAIALVGRTIGQTFPLPGGGLQLNGINCFAPTLTGATGTSFAVSPPRVVPIANTRQRGSWCGAVPTPSNFAINSAEFRAAGFPNALQRDSLRTSLKAEYSISDWTIIGTAAYNSRIQPNFTDQDYSDARVAGFETYAKDGQRDRSFEFKVQSPANERLRGQAGVYSYYEKDNSNNFSGDLRKLVNGGNGTVFRVGDDPTQLPRNSVFLSSARNIAVFGQLEFQMTDQFKVSAEARYQEDKIAFVGTSTASVTIGGVSTPFTRNITADLSRAKYKAFLPRVTADYKITDDALIYAVVAKGNKPGDFNTGVYSAIYDDAQVADFAARGLANFKEETIWSYEAGLKTAWFDKRLIANLSAYFIDWKNQQLTQTTTGLRRDGVLGALSFTTNVGKSQVKGLELELTARPTEYLELRASYALQDTKIKDYLVDDQADFFITAADVAALNATPLFNGLAFTSLPTLNTIVPGSNPPRRFVQSEINTINQARVNAANTLINSKGNTVGNALPRVPKHQIQLGATVFADVTSEVKASLRADLSYESKRFVQVDNFGYSGDSYDLKLRATIEYQSFKFTAFLNNALNDKTPVDVLRYIDTQQVFLGPNLRGFGNSSIFPRDFGVTAARRRQAGVTVSYKF